MAKEQAGDGAAGGRRGSIGTFFASFALLLLGCSMGANLWLGSEVIDLQQQVREAGVRAALAQRRPELRLHEGGDIERGVVLHSGTAQAIDHPAGSDAKRLIFSPKSPVVQLTKESFETLFKALPSDKPVFINFFAPWCVWSQRIVPEYEKLAHFVSKDDAVIAAVDCVEQAELCREQRILAFPTLILYLDGKPILPQYKKDRTAEMMKDFIFVSAHNHTSSLKPKYPRTYVRRAYGGSGASPKAWDTEREAMKEDPSGSLFPSSPVVKLTKENFDAVLKYKSGNKPVFVNYCTPWAVWCQRLVPQYQKLAQIVPKNEAIIASVDCLDQAELCREKRINAFPSLVLYLDGGNTIYSPYKEDRTAVAMKRYIVEKSRNNISVSASSSSASVPHVPVKLAAQPTQGLGAVSNFRPAVVSTYKDDRKISEDDVASEYSADSEPKESTDADDAPTTMGSQDRADKDIAEEDSREGDQIAFGIWGNGPESDYARGSESYASGSGEDLSGGASGDYDRPIISGSGGYGYYASGSGSGEYAPGSGSYDSGSGSASGDYARPIISSSGYEYYASASGSGDYAGGSGDENARSSGDYVADGGSYIGGYYRSQNGGEKQW